MSCVSDTNILTFDISFICSVEKRILLFFTLGRSEYPALYMFLNFPFGFQIFVFVKPINKHKRMRKPFLHFWCQGIKNDRFLQNAGWSFHSWKEEHFHNNNNDHWNRDQRRNQLYINKHSLKMLVLVLNSMLKVFLKWMMACAGLGCSLPRNLIKSLKSFPEMINFSLFIIKSEIESC